MPTIVQAAYDADKELVEECIDRGCTSGWSFFFFVTCADFHEGDINGSANDRRTALHVAALKGELEYARLSPFPFLEAVTQFFFQDSQVVVVQWSLHGEVGQLVHDPIGHCQVFNEPKDDRFVYGLFN